MKSQILKKRNLVLSIFAVFLFILFANAAQFSDTTQSNFNNGTHNNTYYNTTYSAVSANNTSPTPFSSNVVDMTGNVLLYHMDEISGNISDYSGSGNTGIPSGVVNYNQSGQVNRSFNLSGGIVAVPSLTQDVYSISFWFKDTIACANYPDPCEWGTPVAQASDDTNGWQFRRYSSQDHYFFRTSNGDSELSNIPVTGTWKHIVIVKNESNAHTHIYLNGIETYDLDTTWETAGYVVLGPPYFENTQRFGGSLDEVAIWNRTLSADEVLRIYQKQSGNFTFGTFTSRIFNTNFSQFNNFSWKSNFGELLANGQSTLMQGNKVLYHLDELSGTIIDYSGNGNNGTSNGDVEYNSEGKINRSLSFNGEDSTVSFSNIGVLSNFTVSMWIKRNRNGATEGLFGSGNGGNYIFEYFGDQGSERQDRIGFGLHTSGGNNYKYAAATPIVDTNWHNIILKRSGSAVEVWIDGVNQFLTDFVGSNTAGTINTNANYYIGSQYEGDNKFSGSIDEFSIWNRSLSTSEVYQVYEKGVVNLNLSARSCGQANCLDSEFINFGTNSSPIDLSSFESNSYFQYKFDLFGTSNSPAKLYNVSLDYTPLKIGFVAPTESNNTYRSRNSIAVNVSVQSSIERNITFKLFNATSIVNLTFSNSSLRLINWTNLAQGVYYYNVTLGENDNSTTSTETRKITLDTTAPNGTLTTPVNNTISNVTSQNYTANLTDNLNLKNATLNIVDNETGDVVNQTSVSLSEGTTSTLIGVIVDLVDGVYNWFYKFFDRAGNQLTTGNNTIQIDTVPTDISNFIFYPNDTYDFDPDTFITLNVSAMDEISGVENVTLFYNIGDLPDGDELSIDDVSNGNAYENTSVGGNLYDCNGYTYYFYVYAYKTIEEQLIYSANPEIIIFSENCDFDSNYFMNLSWDSVLGAEGYIVVVHNDDYYGRYDNYYFDTSNTFTTYGDGNEDNGINEEPVITSSPIFSTQHYTFGDYIVMDLIDSENGIYSANITTDSDETNYSFYIASYDNAGNYNKTNITTIESAWERFWNISLDFNVSAGRYDQNKYLGNLSVINNADFPFTFNYFRDNSPTGGLLYDGEFYVPTFTLYSNHSFKDSKSISLNGTFSSNSREDNVTITVKTSTGIAQYSNQTTSFSMISYAGGPFFNGEIDNYMEKINQSSNFTFGAILENLGDEYSYNTTLNWTIPDEFIGDYVLLAGNESKLLENLSAIDISGDYTSRLDINISIGSDIAAGTYELIFNALGVNSSGDSSQYTNKSSSKQITLYCSQTDGVCGAGCSFNSGNQFYDIDCSAPVVSVTSGGGGGGGAGGGGGGALQSRSDYTITRGKQNEIPVPFKNKNNNLTMSELKFSVSGDIAKYIVVEPSSLSTLGPLQETNIILRITSPTYIALGQQTVILHITGRLGDSVYTEDKKIVIQVNALPKEQVETMLAEIDSLINKLEGLNLSSTKLEILLNESRKAFDALEYEKVEENYNIIKKQVESALEADKTITELKALIEDAQERGIDTKDAERLLKLAELSIERADFEQAETRAKDARNAFALEFANGTSKLTYYLKNNGKEIALSALALLVISFTTYELARLQLLRRKIKKLREEEFILTQLMKLAQDMTFKQKKMEMEEYRETMLQYEKKMANVIEQIIDSETEMAHVLKFTSSEKKLKSEKATLIELVKEIQYAYLKKGTMETRAYELKIESYNRRLGEIDEKLAELEAKKAMKGFN